MLSEDEEENQKRFDNHDRNVNEEKQNETTRYKGYNEPKDGVFKEQSNNTAHWREDAMRMSNIVEELENRCKILVSENHQLEAMIHKCRTEYDVETTYLKNQVKNERERQSQWKELYFKAYSELMELKRQNPFHSPKNADVEYVVRRGSGFPPRPRTDSGCQECEDERKRKASESENSGSRHSSSHSLYPGPHVQERISVSNAGMPPSKSMHHSPVEPSMVTSKPPHHTPADIITEEDISRPPVGLPVLQSPPDMQRPSFAAPMIPSQVYKPDLHSPREHKQYFKCQLCAQYYDSEQKLRFHMELHSERYVPGHTNDFPDNHPNMNPTDYYICPECNQSFNNDENYRQHLLVHVFKCRFCGQTMDNEMNYLVHIKSHSESINLPPYFCFLCDKQFSHITHLTRHVRMHPDEQPFECPECGKHFSRKGHLTRHLAMHSKTRPYTCTDCNKTFAHRTHLRRHEIVHSGLRPHQCKVCHQSFSRKSSLSRHYFIHTTEKPFVCPVCEKGFNRKGRLKNHLKIHIREGYPELVDYVIERRPITKEFIEKINEVKSDELLPQGPTENYSAQDELTPNAVSEDPEYATTQANMSNPHVQIVKDESDESSCSDSEEGDIDEVEANMSEEICYYEPAQPLETNNNNIYQNDSLASTATMVNDIKSENYTTSPLNT